VSKVAGLAPSERGALAWGVAVFGGLVVGAIVLRFVGHALAPSPGAPRRRFLGGLLGAAKGVFVLVVVGYLVLGGPGDVLGPSLSHSSRAEAEAADPVPLASRLRGTWTGRALRRTGRLLADWLVLPPWVRERVDAVNRRLLAAPAEGAGPSRRPRNGD
jgi:hypothetical protein